MRCLDFLFKLLGVTNLSCFLTYTSHLLPSEPWPSDDDGGDSDDDDGYGPDDEIEVTSTHQPVKKLTETYVGTGRSRATKRTAGGGGHSMILDEAEVDNDLSDDAAIDAGDGPSELDSEEEEVVSRFKKRKTTRRTKKKRSRIMLNVFQVCLLTCFFSCLLVLKAYSHCLHLYGFSPV